MLMGKATIPKPPSAENEFRAEVLFRHASGTWRTESSNSRELQDRPDEPAFSVVLRPSAAYPPADANKAIGDQSSADGPFSPFFIISDSS
jgi:hypothetical protein